MKNQEQTELDYLAYKLECVQSGYATIKKEGAISGQIAEMEFKTHIQDVLDTLADEPWMLQHLKVSA